MPRPIEVRAKLDAEFEGGRQEIKREFDRIGDDADRAAKQVKDAFSDVGDRSRPEFDKLGRSAREAADEIEREFSDIGSNVDLSDLGGSVTGQISDLFSGGGPLAGAAIGVGAILADDLATGFNRGFSGQRRQLELSIKTGLEGVQLEEVGAAAGSAYASGFGESLADVSFAAGALEKELGNLAGGFDLSEVTAESQLLADQFGIELPEQIRLVRRLVAGGLVPDVTSGMGLIFDSAQRLPATFSEVLDVLDEYAPTFRGMGISGAEAADFISEAFESGVFENASQAAEAVREFNTRLTETDELRGAIGELGLDFEGLQQAAANGDLPASINATVDALADMEDKQLANELAGQLFGTAVEDVTDRLAAVQALKMGDEFAEISDGLDEATASLAANQSELEKVQRNAEGFASIIGTEVAGEINNMIGGVELLASGFGLLSDSTDEAADSARDGGDGFALMLDATEEASKGVSGLTDEVVGLDEALSGFSDRFEADQIFRSLDEDIASLTEATADLTLGSFDLALGFDTSTDAGRRAEAAAERLSGNLDTLVQGFQENTIGAGELAAGQAEVQEALRQVASQMGLTQGQTDALIAKYGEVPADVTTALRTIDEASSGVFSFLENLNRIPTERITFLRTVDQGSRALPPQRVSGTGGGNARFARGGLADGFALVGEEGPELVDFQTPSRVYSNEDTQRILAGEPSGNGGSFDQLVGAFRQALEEADIRGLTIEQIIVDEGRDVFAEIDAAAQRFAPALR